ncbi:MAG: Flagellar hook-associated protein 2 [Lachnoclostridium sp.]|jgi:flagellar hook-associated protein 2
MGTIRMTGMISGLDTEAIVKELVSAQKLKNKKVSDKLTLSEWKEEKWKELNTKLYNLYKTSLNKVRLQGSYMTKKVTSSNTNLIEVTGDANAPEGAHTIVINQLASSQYVTSGKLNKDITGSTTLRSLLDLQDGNDDGTSINDLLGGNAVIQITYGEKVKNLVLTDKTTINDFITSCKEIGLNASFDTSQKRIFISSKESGVENAFTIKTGKISDNGKSAYDSINTILGIDSLSSTDKTAVLNALDTLRGLSEEELTKLYTAYENNDSESVDKNKLEAVKTLINYGKKQAEAVAVTNAKAEIKEKLLSENSLDDVLRNYLKEQKAKELGYDDVSGLPQEEIDAIDIQLGAMVESDKEKLLSTVVDSKYNSDETYKQQVEEAVSEKVTNLKESLKVYAKAANEIDTTTTYSDALTVMGLGEIDGTENIPGSGDKDKKMTVIAAADAEVELDGATITGASNTISVNGMTLNLKGVSSGQKISINVSNDSQAAYDMVKSFISSYNSILKEMNELYYADSASGYAPLSDEQKKEMSDDEIEKWENKIKAAILRRDSTLGSLIDAMKNAMSSSFEVDGKKYYLSTFGIQTSTDYSEKGLLHIYGDTDDSTYADKDDKLLKALSEDPETTMKALAGIFQNLYDTMRNNMSSIPNVRSIYTFYNDKLLDKEQAEYKEQVAKLEKKLEDLEDKYYKQFSAMETALAKLQAQSNALAGLLGTSSSK